MRARYGFFARCLEALQRIKVYSVLLFMRKIPVIEMTDFYSYTLCFLQLARAELLSKKEHNWFLLILV